MSLNNIRFLIDLNIKEFPSNFQRIKNEIIFKNNLCFDSGNNALKVFTFLLNNFGFKLFNNLKYISKDNSNFIYNRKLSKQFVVNNISLLFIFLYCQNKISEIQKEEDVIIYEKSIIKLYKTLFKIIKNIYNIGINNNIISLNDIFEIIRLNLLLGLDDLLNKSFIFNESIIFLINIYFSNENNANIQGNLKLIFSLIYTNLLKSERELQFIKRDKNLYNFSILEITKLLSSSQINTKLKDLILELLILIYKYDYSSLISDYILDKIKEGFYELKANNMKRIIRCIKNINGLLYFLDLLFLQEENEKDDLFFPSSYFVFFGNEYSGINYNPSIELLKKNFTIIFTFKINNIKEDIIYPLISFVTHGGKNEIILNISIQNGKLLLYNQSEKKFIFVEGISINKCYMVIIEYKNGILKDKIKIYINNKKALEFSSGAINIKENCSLQIGYLSINKTSKNSIFNNINNFNGIIGPILQFSNIFDDKNFISNIFKLKGNYDLILLMNNMVNFDNYFKYETNKYFSDYEINSLKNYFSELSSKINKDLQYSICPLSIINSINTDTNYFCQDIYNKSKLNTNKAIFPDFNTLFIPSPKFLSTYAKQNLKSLPIFIEYDGIPICILIVEYFYNVLRMLIKSPKEEKMELVNEIYEVLSILFKILTKIIISFIPEAISDNIDTLGFSIKKLFSLISDIQPLNEKIIIQIIGFVEKTIIYYKELDSNKSKKILIKFLSQFIYLFISSKYLIISNYPLSEQLFRMIHSVVENNHDFINIYLLNNLLYFSYVLDPLSLDKNNNKPKGTIISSDNGYKKMKKEYKYLISEFIKNSSSLQFYFNYLKKVFNNQNSNWTEKYKLIKIYYKFHKIQRFYKDKERKDSNNNFEKEKNIKSNFFSEEELFRCYQEYFLKLIYITEPQDENIATSLELLKTFLIMLIYEHKIIIPLNINNEIKEKSSIKTKISDTKRSLIKNADNDIGKISFFSSFSSGKKDENILEHKDSLSSNNSGKKILKLNEIEFNNIRNFSESSAEEKEASTQSSKSLDNKNNNNKEIYLFDEFLNTKKFSFYTIKGLFMCLCDKFDKTNKIKFIKSKEDNFDLFNEYINKFDRNKKELFFQFLSLIECVNDENILEKCIKLIISFIKDNCIRYIFYFSDKICKSIFLHLFESKSIFNKFFSFCLTNELLKTKETNNYIINSIKYINNIALLNHPNPYIFSFIKNCIKLNISETIMLIDELCKTILKELKSLNTKINYFFYQNLLHFIKTLVNASEKNSNNFTKLFLRNNFELFHNIQKFIKEILNSEIVYDPNLHVFHPYLFNQFIDEKKEEKIFHSSKTKLINNQIVIIYLFQLALNFVYLIWKSQEQNKDAIDIALNYVSKIHEEMQYNKEYITYFLDLSNPYFTINNKHKEKPIPERISKLIYKDINNNFQQKNIIFIRDSRIVSFSLFLILLKYQTLLINYSKNKIADKNQEYLIRKAFEPLISLSEKEINFLIPNIIKLKDNKNFENIMEKAESKSKEFKNFNKNCYKHFLEKFKNKNYDMKQIKAKIVNKYIFDEYQNQRLSLNDANNLDYNVNKNEKKEKPRKDSFGEYNEENIIMEEKVRTNIINEDTKNNNNKKNIENYDESSLDFESAKYPILCTKRDLILKKFGYFYYRYFFKSYKFISLKKLFLLKYKTNDKNNNYHGFEKIMKNKYSFIIKNFSNNQSYYPRLFFRPYHKLFDNKYFKITHSYFNNEKYDKKNNEKIMHLEYGHGLLNQSNFDLYNISDKNEKMNKYICNSFNGGNDDEFNVFNLGKLLEKYEDNYSLLSRETFFQKKNSQKTNIKSNFLLKRQLTIDKNLIKNKLNVLNSENQKEHYNPHIFECEKISHKNVSNGAIIFGNYFLVYQSNVKFDKTQYIKNPNYLFSSSEYELLQEEKQIIIPYNSISQILYRKYLFYEIAVEIFLYNGKSYYFNFYNIENKNKFMKIMKEKIKEEIIIKNSIEYFEKKKYSNKWLEGKISTSDYLLLINKFSDRSYNTLTQYLIFPWLFSDIDNIYNSENIRNFNYSPIIKNKIELKNNIMEGESEGYFSYYSNFYSNYMYVNHYMFRMFPYLYNQIKLQDGKLDEPGRQFNSLSSTLKIFKENPHINIELIPEFYFIPELFLNLNVCFYGEIKCNDVYKLINNVGVEPGFHNILELINYHQISINSEHITSKINKWIDYAFGERQISLKNDSVKYFPKECYEKYIKEEFDEECKKLKSIIQDKSKGELTKLKTFPIYNLETNISSTIQNTRKKLKDALNKSYFYGQCPTQIFTKGHPAFDKKIEPKIYNLSDKDNFQVISTNAQLMLQRKDILYMQESSNGNYFYIVYEHEIEVYNKHLKLINNLSINYISKIPDCFSIKYHTYDNYFKSMKNYKYIIFDIFDCKYFIIGGYIDNSLRIYYKDKEKDIILYFYFDSQIKCIRNSLNDKTFFSGHRNGKIIKWSYQINNNNNQINLIQMNSIRGHKSSVKMIELNEKYECIISIDDDEVLFIRKLYDFELLSYVKFNKYNKKVIDINIYNQIILLTIFKIKKNEIFIYTYSMNGLKFGKISAQLKLPISVIPNTDEIIIFSIGNIYAAKISFNEKTSLLPFSNNFENSNIDFTSQKDDEIIKNFNNDIISKDVISYFYDSKNRMLFCLFSEGILYRINIVKNT